MKKVSFILITLLVLCSTLIGCASSESLEAENLIVKDLNGIDESTLTEYFIDVELDTKEMTYYGEQVVNYVNNTDIALEEVYFHIYPNAWEKSFWAPLFDSWEEIDHEKYVPGYINMEKVASSSKDLNWNVEGNKNTILKVELDRPLEIGEKIELYLEYEVKLPNTEERFGYHDKGINLGNWYPVMAVYDEKGWNLDPYYNYGDPFYSETSNYRVNIRVPKNMKIAASGKILSEEVDKGKKKYEIQGKLIRDFSWAASKNFKIKERLVDGTVLRVYSINRSRKFIDQALDLGEKSLKAFNEAFGKYPYGQYSIVVTKFPSGMEYPGLVYISDAYPAQGILERVIAHETAHQWWYGLVGNDQVDEAWLDEGLATYSEAIYFNEVYGKEKADWRHNTIKSNYDSGVKGFGKGKVVNKPLSEFKNGRGYGALVYEGGAMLLVKIKEDFGEEVLYNILKEYYKEYKFYIARTEDFIGVCEEVTGVSFYDLEMEYLNGGYPLAQ